MLPGEPPNIALFFLPSPNGISKKKLRRGPPCHGKTPLGRPTFRAMVSGETSCTSHRPASAVTSQRNPTLARTAKPPAKPYSTPVVDPHIQEGFRADA